MGLGSALHYDFTLVHELALVPVGTVPKVGFACGRINGKGRGSGLVVRTALVSPRLRVFVFRIWHGSKYVLLLVVFQLVELDFSQN